MTCCCTKTCTDIHCYCAPLSYALAPLRTRTKTRTTIEVAVVQSRSRVREWLVPDTCPERQLDNIDHTMIGYRHPPLFTQEHGCVSFAPSLDHSPRGRTAHNF